MTGSNRLRLKQTEENMDTLFEELLTAVTTPEIEYEWLVEPGDYRVTVKSAKAGVSRGGHPQIKLVLMTLEGKLLMRYLTASSDTATRYAMSDLAALGITADVLDGLEEYDDDTYARLLFEKAAPMLVGRAARVDVTQDDTPGYTDRVRAGSLRRV
jgi:hypothetical protein